MSADPKRPPPTLDREPQLTHYRANGRGAHPLGIGYQASALRHITYLVPPDGPVQAEPPLGWRLPHIPGMAYPMMPKPAAFRSPNPLDIVAWRDALAAKYLGQLDERLTWDEAGEPVKGDEASSGADLLLRYAAATAEEDGPAALRRLKTQHSPPRSEIERALGAAALRGFTGSFPQLLLAGRFWLPFRRNMIIEEPDWEGRLERFGSSFRLGDELKALRGLIRDAEPEVERGGTEGAMPPSILSVAWQASETILDICSAAIDHRLPLWSAS